MRTSPRGIALLKQFEGLVLHSYDDFDASSTPIMDGDDVLGTLTIGYGHTGKDVKPGLRITPEEAELLLKRDLLPRELVINNSINVPMRQSQFDAMVDLCYNIGSGNFLKSSVRRHMNRGDDHMAADSFKLWNKSKGKIMRGLVRRRKAEKALFNSPD